MADEVVDLEARLKVVLTDFLQSSPGLIRSLEQQLGTGVGPAIDRAVGKSVKAALKSLGRTMSKEIREELGRAISAKPIIEAFEQVRSQVEGKSLGIGEAVSKDVARAEASLARLEIDFGRFNDVLAERNRRINEYRESLVAMSAARNEQRELDREERRNLALLRKELASTTIARREQARAGAEADRRATSDRRRENDVLTAETQRRSRTAVETARQLTATVTAATKQETAEVVEGERRKTIARRDAATMAAEVQRRVTADAIAASRREVIEAQDAARARAEVDARYTAEVRAQIRERLAAQRTANRQIIIAAESAAKDQIAANKRLQTRLDAETRDRSVRVKEGQKRITLAAEASAKVQVEAARQARIGAETQGKLMVLDRKRMNERLLAEDKARVQQEGHLQSLIRIREQGEQQRRLARTQQFYKLMGDAARGAGAVTIAAGSTLAGRLFHVEQRVNDDRVAGYRHTESRIEGVERAGFERREGLLRRFFLRRNAEERASYQRSEALSLEAQRRASRGVLGAATGNSALSGILPVTAGLGVGASLVKALSVTSDFTSALAELRVAAGASAGEMAKVRKVSIDLGNDVKLPGVSAKDAADAFRILAVSGVDLQSSLNGGAKAALQLSRATGTDAEEAAKSVAAAINVFRFSGKEALSVADGLAVATSLSGASLAEFNDSYKQIGITFSQTFKQAQPASKTFRELSAVLALFARNGLRGEQAGTNLKVMLQRLSNVRGKAAGNAQSDILAAAGLPRDGQILTDATGRVRKFAEVLDILRRGVRRLPTEEARLKALNNLFGTRSSIGALLLSNTSDKQFDALLKAVDREGFAADRAAAKNAGLKGGLDALGSAAETVAILVGRKVEPFLRSAAVAASNFITNLSQGGGAWRTARFALLGVAGALGAIIAAKGAVEVLGLLRLGLSALATPGGIVTVGIAGIAGGLAAMAAGSKSAREALARVRDRLQEFAGGALDVAKVGLRAVGDAFARFADWAAPRVIAALKAVGSWISRTFGPALSRVVEFVSTLGERARSAGRDLVAGFQGSGAAGFFVTLGRAAGAAYRWVRAVTTVVVELLSEGYRGLTGGGGLIGFIRGIGETARDVVDLVQRLGSNIASAFSSGGSIVERVGSVFSGLGPIVNDLFGGVPELIGNVVRTKLIDPVKAEWTRFFGNGQEWYVGLLGLVRDIGLRLGRTVTAVLTDRKTLAVVGTVLAAVASTALAAASGFIQGVLEKLLERLRSVLPDFFKTLPVVGPLLRAFDGAVKPISAILTGAVLGGLALKVLAGPVGRAAQFISSVFGATTRKGLIAALKGNQAGLASLASAEATAAAKRASADQNLGKGFGGPGGSMIAGVSALRAAWDRVGQSFVNVRRRIGDGIAYVQLWSEQAVRSARRASPAFDRFADRVGSRWDELKRRGAAVWDPLRDKASTAFTAIGVKAIDLYEKVGGLKGVVQGVASAATGFFSGLAISSSDVATRIGGVTTAIGEIGFLLATGNPILAGLAAVGAAFGVIVGRAQSARAELQGMRDDAASVTEQLIRGDAGALASDILDRVKGIITKTRDGFDVVNTKVGGLQRKLQTAFTLAQAGKLSEGLDLLKDQFDQLGRFSTPMAVGSFGATRSRLRELRADLTEFGVQSSELTFKTRDEAERVAAFIRDQIPKLAAEGKIAPRVIFDRTVVREIDGAYTVLRLGIRGANEEQQKFYDAVARNALSLAAGYEDVKGPLGDIEQLQNRITAEMQLQGKLRLDDQTFVERINSELATYNQRVSDITTKLRDAQGSNFSDVGDQIASLAQATSDAAERIKANRGVISSPFDTSEAAANARQAASQVRSTFQQQVANVLAQPGITPEGALQQIQALQANLIDVARKAGADRQTIETIRGLIQVPDLKLAGDSIRIADSEQVQREARSLRDDIQKAYEDNHATLPVDLVPFINENSAFGQALRYLIDTGFFGGAARAQRQRVAGQANRNERGRGIPQYARGDIVRRPTFGIFGEAGPEVVLPLSKPDRVAKLAHDALAAAGRDPMMEIARQAASAGGSSVPQYANGALFGGYPVQPPNLPPVGKGKGPFRTGEGDPRDIIDRRVGPFTAEVAKRIRFAKIVLDQAVRMSILVEKAVGNGGTALARPVLPAMIDIQARAGRIIEGLDELTARNAKVPEPGAVLRGLELIGVRGDLVKWQTRLARWTAAIVDRADNAILVGPGGQLLPPARERKGRLLARGIVARGRIDNATIGEAGVEVLAPRNDPRRAQQLLDSGGVLERLPVTDKVSRLEAAMAEMAGAVATMAREAPAAGAPQVHVHPAAGQSEVLIGAAAVRELRVRRLRGRVR